ncbi:toll/interleukin-1 receptor domain-containing protein [Kocuria marina]|uniref:toll/interleukin-1 receptor domain-containing protein n=1 Tax=Kocuria marina TaxID=223184 RepID=UPI0015FECB7B|nr:toll/interleukin-1 receptor domain-containing protein [Kocuria indica]
MQATQSNFSPEPPAVFVSYSRCGEEHQAWVANLARRLRANGVDVHLDLWDVSLGQDLNLFMEQYADPSARVLVILSDDYASKANDRGQRASGVATETTIVSPTVYENLGGNRVIPVIPASGTAAGVPLVPRYLKSRNWIDFRSGYEDAYERLLRELHGVPLEPAPPLGPNPFIGKTASQATAAIRNDAARWRDGRGQGRLKINLHENSGCFVIGTGESAFHLFLDYPSSLVAPGAPRRVRHYRDGFNKLGLVAAAAEHPKRLQDLPSLPMSNRVEEAACGDVAIMLNHHGYWALLILDEVEFEQGLNGFDPIACLRYAIATDRTAELTLESLPQ